MIYFQCLWNEAPNIAETAWESSFVWNLQWKWTFVFPYWRVAVIWIHPCVISHGRKQHAPPPHQVFVDELSVLSPLIVYSRNVILLRFSPSLFRFFINLFHSWHIIRLVVGGCGLSAGLTFKHTPSSRWKFEMSSATFIIAHASSSYE